METLDYKKHAGKVMTIVFFRHQRVLLKIFLKLCLNDSK